ncbi:hypothetical protein H6P81_021475 [Aristolochia fimbriata]|uniref:Uncharacterized protein n=2 Tax=Magnoliopsida TaxID=3398 RepID=A0AAV7DRF5_ARIFI|nr:hypothetical protein H6P81_021475 [Aristolochia fimbriata]
MDWCGSSTPRTPEYRTMNQERHERKAYWLVVRPQFLTGKDTKRLCPPLWDGRGQLVFHVVKELNNENRWRVPDRIDRVMGAENPSLSRLYYRGLWGSRNRRALILGWAYYLDAFSSYPLRTWLPSVYRGHDNWYTRGASFPVVRIFTDMSISPSLSPRQCPDRYAFRAGRNLPDKEFRYLRTVIVTAAVHRGFGRRLPCHQVTNFLDLPALGRRQPPPYVVLRLRGDLCFWYPFVEGRSSFSWEYGMGYFSAVAPGTRTLARGIFSTPSYPALKKQGFRGIGFSPMFALLKPTFSLPLRPHLLARVLSSKAERSPTDAFLHPTASADRLAPFIFGARALDQHAVRDPILSSHCLGAHGFMFYFTPRWGFFSPFPHGTTSLSVTQEYLALQGGPCGFTRDSTCPMLLGSERKLVMLSATGLSPSRVQYSTASPSSTTLVLLSHNPVFTFARLSLACPWIQQQFERLTYSGISGSMLIFNSPKHFVACYALPRLWVPRYPP